ncbi:nucleoside-triphosphatase [Clostridium weizhouense]|uniref:Nucleoside-triphosphatase n=1 Tax=Clostridium weizhouense TaxID=2859781 RepID=A0ABS7AMN1_9CLOT|nr:nucleoside-triphosphatase [Clostridium weizhouense]MBW6408750.1 nucleoside-triphosphatase [Clostridium weizhouense]
MYKNIFITGKIQCGKSTLINKVLDELKIAYSGYRTLPYYINGEKGGYYIETINLKHKLKDKISINISSQKCTALIKGFDITGVEILRNSMEDKVSKIILLDEIGILEKCSSQFIKEINNCLNNEKLVIGVLKRKDDEFLNGISERSDSLVINIEQSTYEERENIKKQIIKYIENVFR